MLAEAEPDRFSLTPESQFLLDAHPFSLRGAYALMPADVRAWAHMEYSLRTGLGAFEHVHGRSLWQYLSEHPAAAAWFDRSMADMSRLETVALLDAYDWAQFRTIVDVGGGMGVMLIGTSDVQYRAKSERFPPRY